MKYNPDFFKDTRYTTRIFDACENPRALAKAVRGALGYSQRKMATQLLTCQCYICWFETGNTYRKMPNGEFERIIYNLKIELEEQLLTAKYSGEERKLLVLCDVIIRYLRLSNNSKDKKQVKKILNDILTRIKEEM